MKLRNSLNWKQFYEKSAKRLMCFRATCFGNCVSTGEILYLALGSDIHSLHLSNIALSFVTEKHSKFCAKLLLQEMNYFHSTRVRRNESGKVRFFFLIIFDSRKETYIDLLVKGFGSLSLSIGCMSGDLIFDKLIPP